MFECSAFRRADDRACERITLEAGISQLVHQDQSSFGRLDQVVVEFRVNAHGFVGRQRPRGGRPDHSESRGAQMRQAKGFGHLSGMVGVDFECDIDGGRILVLMFDFGFGQRRAAVETPVDGFESLIQVALVQNFAERTNLVGLGLEGHRQVGVIPLAEDAQADEVFLLAFDLLGGKAATQRAHLVAGDVLAVQLLDLVFDRQAVAVPARNIRCIETGQRLRADDDVLENLIDRVANVDVTVGIGRTVVQNEARAPFRRFADLFIELLLLPVCDPLRLALGEIAAHGKRCIRQV